MRITELSEEKTKLEGCVPSIDSDQTCCLAKSWLLNQPSIVELNQHASSEFLLSQMFVFLNLLQQFLYSWMCEMIEANASDCSLYRDRRDLYTIC